MSFVPQAPRFRKGEFALVDSLSHLRLTRKFKNFVLFLRRSRLLYVDLRGVALESEPLCQESFLNALSIVGCQRVLGGGSHVWPYCQGILIHQNTNFHPQTPPSFGQ